MFNHVVVTTGVPVNSVLSESAQTLRSASGVLAPFQLPEAAPGETLDGLLALPPPSAPTFWSSVAMVTGWLVERRC